MKIIIELRPMVASQMTELGPIEVPLGQSMVLAKTGERDKLVHVAYICDPPGSPFNGLHTFRTLPQAIKDAIVEETMRIRGEADKPKVSEPPKPIDIADLPE